MLFLLLESSRFSECSCNVFRSSCQKVNKTHLWFSGGWVFRLTRKTRCTATKWNQILLEQLDNINILAAVARAYARTIAVMHFIFATFR